LLVEQLLEIIFTFFTLKVVDEPPAPAPEVEVLAEEDGLLEDGLLEEGLVEEDPIPEDDSEPLPGVPITRI
jgi:hypothetical protein